MKITDIRTIVVGNPWKNWVFVVVETSDGISGLGEATGGLSTMPNKEAVEDAGHINIHTTFGSYITNITSQKENTMGSWTAKLKLKGRIKYTAYN